MKSIADMLKCVAEVQGMRPAIVEEGRTTSYAELLSQVYWVSRDLTSRGALPGDRTALLLPNSLNFVVSYFGIVGAGGVVVPLNDSYQENELEHFIRECGISRIVTSSKAVDLCRKVARDKVEVLMTEDRERSPGFSYAEFVPVDPDQPAMVQFSSGSTGRPKRIARSHRKLLFELDSFVEKMGFVPEDRFLGVAPFSHVNGLMRSMMTSVRAGASLYPLPRFDRRLVASTISKHRLTVFIAVPFMFGMLAKSRFSEPVDFSSLRYCVSASAPMPETINRQFHDAFGHYVRELYGSTETGTISVNLSDQPSDCLRSIGTPIGGVEVAVFREDGSRAEAGEQGEFGVRSPAAIEAYIDLEDVNREVFRNGCFMTGDLGRRDDRGLLFLEGRKTFFINKGGYKINPYDIEELLESHPAVAEIAVVGVPTVFEDEKVKAVVVARADCSEEQLIDFCRGKIADFKIPSVIEFRESLPKSSTGKIRKKMLM